MRWVYLAVIILFALATLIFAVQNLKAVTVSFLGFEGTAPLAVPRSWSTFLALSRAVVCWRSCANPMRGRNGAWAAPDGAAHEPFSDTCTPCMTRSEAAYACGPTKCLPMLYH